MRRLGRHGENHENRQALDDDPRLIPSSEEYAGLKYGVPAPSLGGSHWPGLVQWRKPHSSGGPEAPSFEVPTNRSTNRSTNELQSRWDSNLFNIATGRRRLARGGEHHQRHHPKHWGQLAVKSHPARHTLNTYYHDMYLSSLRKPSG